MGMHAQAEEVRQGGVEVRPVQEGVLVVVTENPFRPLDVHPALRRDFPQQLPRPLQPDVRNLQRGARVGVSAGEVELAFLPGIPPAGADRMRHQILAGAVPLRPDGGLVGDRPGPLPDPASDPLAAGGLHDPGLVRVGDDERVVVGAGTGRAARHRRPPLPVLLDKRAYDGHRLLGGSSALQPQAHQFHSEHPGVHRRSGAVHRHPGGPVAGEQRLVADDDSPFVQAQLVSPAPVRGPTHVGIGGGVVDLYIGQRQLVPGRWSSLRVEAQRLGVGDRPVAVLADEHMAIRCHVGHRDEGVTTPRMQSCLQCGGRGRT